MLIIAESVTNIIFKVVGSIVNPITSELMNSKAKRILDIAIPPADF